jgi:hypothetical protein
MKYKSFEDRADNLFHKVVRISDEVFVFMELRTMCHTWCVECLDEKILKDYENNLVNSLKDTTPNHKLIEVLFSGKSLTDAEIQSLMDSNDDSNDHLKYWFSEQEKAMIPLIPKLSKYESVFRPKKSHAEVAMDEVLDVTDIFRLLRKNKLSYILEANIKATFQEEMAEEVSTRKRKESENEVKKKAKKKCKTQHLNKLFDDDDDDFSQASVQQKNDVQHDLDSDSDSN